MFSMWFGSILTTNFTLEPKPNSRDGAHPGESGIVNGSSWYSGPAERVSGSPVEIAHEIRRRLGDSLAISAG